MIKILQSRVNLAVLQLFLLFFSCKRNERSEVAQRLDSTSRINDSSKLSLLKRGEYLVTIGVCSACHTSPKVEPEPPTSGSASFVSEIGKRSDPDWVKHLDGSKELAGGVPFIIRFSKDMGGVVYSRNITMDMETGLGNWTEDEIFDVIKSGKRKDGSNLFLFAPHTFFKNLAENDIRAIVAYLKEQTPVKNKINERDLPFSPQPASSVSELKMAPSGDNPENARYLLSAIVGCGECHSYHKEGILQEFAGGDPVDPFIGVFRLGPDLPLRQGERGFSAFPYPGYAVLYGGNLTRFGKGGDLSHISVNQMSNAVRYGVSVNKDNYGRQIPLGHVMMWQYYKNMSDADVNAICKYIKNLTYIPHDLGNRMTYYGTDWELAFKGVFGENPSLNDKKIFGK
jgi:cytochrome c553